MRPNLKRWSFPAITAIIIAISAFQNTTIARDSIMTSADIIISLLPIFLLVIVLMALSIRYVDVKRIGSLLGSSSGMKGKLISIIGGIISTGAIYMWYPLLADLKHKGASHENIAIFLYNRAVKLPLLPLMIGYFGIVFSITLLITIIIFSLIQGNIIRAIFNRQRHAS
ncbi:MAG: permease [Nanoarchaeota archaeon]